MPSWIEFRLGCRGLYRLAVFNRGFLAFFDRSNAGALRSFGLLLPLLPVFLWLVWLNLPGPVPSVGLYLAANAIGYIYSWILFPFVILAAAQLLDRNQEAAGCISIYNWTRVLWVFLELPIGLLAALEVGPEMISLLNLGILIASLIIEGFLFIASLRILPWQAAILVAIDVILTLIVIRPISDWLGGTAAT